MKHIKLCYVSMILLGLSVVLCLPFSSAYQIKYYGQEKVNVSFLDKIPSKYFDGVRVIRIYDSNVYHNGRYFVNGIIDIYCKEKYCFENTLVHELAHHQQFLNGDKRFLYAHNEMFYGFEREILNAIV